MVNESERRLILEMIHSGKVTAEEGLSLLQALEFTDNELEDDDDASRTSDFSGAAQPAHSISGDANASHGAAELPTDALEGEPAVGEVIDATARTPDFDRLRRFWVVPLWVGVLVTVLSGVLMYQAQRSFGLGFWFFCAWLPFLIGVVIMVLAWQSRRMRWLHLRVRQKPGERPQNINISLPLPLRTTAWFMRTFGSKIHGLENTSVDELVVALGDSAISDDPLYIEVNEGDDGERVQIYIG